MTTEEKAKAYDEALKQAKKFHTPDSNNSNLKAVLELIFPELRESEDERILNGLIAAMKDQISCGGESYFGMPLKDILAYLEKQKEQKPTECIEDSIKFKEGFKAGRESGLRDGQKYVLDNLDSYGLYKSADWNTEDYEMLHLIIDYFESTKIPMKINTHDKVVDFKEIAEWLKSLRPQSHWKPKGQQLDCLRRMINVSTVDKIDKQFVQDLYDELMAL